MLSKILNYMTPLDYCGGGVVVKLVVVVLGRIFWFKLWEGVQWLTRMQSLLALVFSRSFNLAVLENHNL